MSIKSYSLLAILFNKPITVFDVDASVVVPTAELREEAAVAVFDEEVLMEEVFLSIAMLFSSMFLRTPVSILIILEAVFAVFLSIFERLACCPARSVLMSPMQSSWTRSGIVGREEIIFLNSKRKNLILFNQ